MMDFLAKLLNPGGPMDLATGNRAMPQGMDLFKSLGSILGKGAEGLSMGADAIGGTPHTPWGGQPAPQGLGQGGGLQRLLQQLQQTQRQPQQSPMEGLLHHLFGMKPTNPVLPNMGPITPNANLPRIGGSSGTNGGFHEGDMY